MTPAVEQYETIARRLAEIEAERREALQAPGDEDGAAEPDVTLDGLLNAVAAA